jgi:phosphoglycerol transferase MdoB-like AlkP superfamily enzyme
VSGGRSWIAEGTMLMGLPIRYESVFQHLVALRPQPPSLVSFLRSRGYYTALLAPADRNRPGAYVVNRYGFSELLTLEGLGYRGRPMGWGIVPDQYSLAIAEKRILAPAQTRKQPVFLDFHMVTSHAPWAVVPPLYDDPSHVSPSNVVHEEHGTAAQTVLGRLARYDREPERRFADYEHFDRTLRDGYQATVHYDLMVIAAYLARRLDDAVVILIGDHQPPVLSRSDQSFDSPVHVLTREPKRLQTALSRGFVPGLWVDSKAAPAMSHAELFPLVVETLAARH